MKIKDNYFLVIFSTYILMRFFLKRITKIFVPIRITRANNEKSFMIILHFICENINFID